jgi:hypothetical protein
MTHTIRIELAGPRDCANLIEYLAGRGLSGRLVEANDRCELEVGYAVDAEQRLRDDVSAALDGWLAERHTPFVLTAVTEDEYVLRPPGD